jgi:REP element-mobilizing transposase RayT
MRQLRVLKQGVWYKIHTRINNREPLFRYAAALRVFDGVFRETGLRFVFEIRGLCLEDDRLSFYIRPADGLELPAIMKWMKQVFAQRYNRLTGRIGHIWGDRYWSLIVEDGEAEGAAWVGEPRGETGAGVRPQYRETALQAIFPLIFPPPPAPPPG